MLYESYLAFKQFMLFPGCVIFGVPIAYLLLSNRKVARRCVITLLFVMLYVFSMPYVGTRLAASLQSATPVTGPLNELACGTVAVLTGGVLTSVAGYEGPQPSHSSLERLRYGILLARDTGTGLAIVGGGPKGLAEGPVLARVAVEEFGIHPQLVEDQSANTMEGAANLQALLPPGNAGSLCLVTSAGHMERARDAFAAVGYDVIPAPVGFIGAPAGTFVNFLPHAWALDYSNQWINERLGQVIYALRRLIGGGPADG